jgi:hypothetical protein
MNLVTPILAGIVAALGLQVGLSSFAGYVAECCMNDQYAQPLWYAVLSAPLGGLASIAPGFITGWLAKSKGILAGFMAGLFGSVIYAGTLHTMWHTVVEDGAVVEMLVRLLALGSGAAIVSAAAAGAAQFLRSNRRVQPTCADARG